MSRSKYTSHSHQLLDESYSRFTLLFPCRHSSLKSLSQFPFSKSSEKSVDRENQGKKYYNSPMRIKAWLSDIEMLLIWRNLKIPTESKEQKILTNESEWSRRHFQASGQKHVGEQQSQSTCSCPWATSVRSRPCLLTVSLSRKYTISAVRCIYTSYKSYEWYSPKITGFEN